MVATARPGWLVAGVLLPGLVACQASRNRQEEVPPFVFRSLDLKAQDGRGLPSWALRAPEARYDLRRRLARAQSPRGLIYRNGQPLYRLQAASGTVLNDGEVILLEGAVRLERVGESPLLLRAGRARWLPRQQRMLIDRQPEAYDRQGRLRSRQAEVRFDQDQLLLKGSPSLERWSSPFNPLATLPRQPPAIRLEVPSATWQPGSGQLRAPGPVRGERLANPAAPAGPPQRLRAEGLEGNTLRQTYRFLGTVTVEDPAADQGFQGQDLTVDLAQQRGSSSRPFSAHRGPLQVQGSALQLEAAQRTVRVEGPCRLSRPGERLRANRCLWNWQTGRLQASGAVELQRAAQKQRSQAGELEATLGPQGTVLLANPSGGRVVSQFQVPSRRR